MRRRPLDRDDRGGGVGVFKYTIDHRRDLGYRKSHESFERIYNTCWRYYRELEHSLAETRRYVAFDESNFSTFSLPSESTVVTLDETIKLLPWKGFGVERKKNARGALRYNYADGKKKLP